MVDKQVQTRGQLTKRDYASIRYLRYCGLSQECIGERYSVSRQAVSRCIETYNLDAPVGELEAVKLEMLATFSETNRRLKLADVSHADHTRLCGIQTKQALALARLLKFGFEKEDKVMGRKSDEERQRILSMTDEEAMNELRRVAGLEHKFTGVGATKDTSGNKSCVDEPFSAQGDACPKTTGGD